MRFNKRLVVLFSILLVVIIAAAGTSVYLGMHHMQGYMPSQQEISKTTQTFPVFVWKIIDKGEGQYGNPLKSVVITIGADTYTVGTYDNCDISTDMSDSDANEASPRVICYWAGGGDEVGLFNESGLYVVKVGQIDEPTAESPAFRGNFKTVITLNDPSPHAIFPFVGDDFPAKFYTDPVYGFTIEYPSDMKMQSGTWIYPDGAMRVFSNYNEDMYRDETNQVEGYIEIAVSTSSNAIADCGKTYNYIPYDGKVTESSLSKTSSFLHGNACIYVAYNTFSSCCDLSGGNPNAQTGEDKMSALFEQVVKTFSF